jgi:aminoglycoside 6-adenylyltransferase
MRSEREMLDLIIGTAREDERIRAVLLSGSRANPDATRDPFQDFDVVYLVTEVESFKSDAEWHKRFGDIMVMQRPDDMGDPPPESRAGYAYLMQFMDGNRIDLSLYPAGQVADLLSDSLMVVLLDKDNLVPELPAPTEQGYWPKPPTAKQFFDCCNEFWWCAPYVAKGLWREQLTYAKGMLDGVLRDQLMKVIGWYMATCPTCTHHDPGYLGRYLKEALPPTVYGTLMQTYSGPDCNRTWEGLEAMIALFRSSAIPVAERLGFEYPYGEDERVSAHLRHVKLLPRDATEIY